MSDKARRKLARGIALTLPTIWTIPIVHSVLLPVHAQTSPTESLPTECEVEFRWLIEISGGSWSGFGAFSITQPPGGTEIEGDSSISLDAPGLTTRTLNLPPGTYGFEIGGQLGTGDSSVDGELTMSVSCCTDDGPSFLLVVSGPGSNTDTGEGTLVLNDDGTCEVPT